MSQHVATTPHQGGARPVRTPSQEAWAWPAPYSRARPAKRQGLQSKFLPPKLAVWRIGAGGEPYRGSNDEVERRGASPASNEGTLFQSSTPSLAQRRRDPRSLQPIVSGPAELGHSP